MRYTEIVCPFQPVKWKPKRNVSYHFPSCLPAVPHLKSLFHVKQAFFKQNYFSFQLFRAIIETFMRINDMERKQIAISFCFWDELYSD